MNSSHGPRITLQRFVQPNDGAYRVWVENVQRARHAAGERSLQVANTGITWKLAAANRRILATGAILFETMREAHGHAIDLVEGFDAAEIELLKDGRQFGWRIQRHGTVIAVGNRWYVASRERDLAIAVMSSMLTLGVDVLVAPIPFDVSTQMWSVEVDRSLWRDQVIREIEHMEREIKTPRTASEPHGLW